MYERYLTPGAGNATQLHLFIYFFIYRVIRNDCRANGEVISARKHNYNCMLGDGIY
jgi:hypothetical protein